MSKDRTSSVVDAFNGDYFKQKVSTTFQIEELRCLVTCDPFY